MPERLGDCAVLVTLNLLGCFSLTVLPDRLGDYAALMTLDLSLCSGLTVLPELGDCATLTTLNLRFCTLLPSHLDVAERLKARDCDVMQ